MLTEAVSLRMKKKTDDREWVSYSISLLESLKNANQKPYNIPGNAVDFM